MVKAKVTFGKYFLGCCVSISLQLFGCGPSKQISVLDHAAQHAGDPSSQIVVSENTAVSNDSDRVFTEPYVVANPRNPAHLLVGAISGVYPEGGWTSNCTSFVSHDGGRQWREHRFPTKQCSDPWVVILDDQAALFSGVGPAGVEVFRSDNGGRSWSDKPASVLPALDHPILATRTGSNIIYVAGERGTSGESRTGPLLARSVDDGRTFQVITQFFPNEFQNSVGAPAVLNDGTIILPFSSYAKSSVGIQEPEFLSPPYEWTVTSRDRGQTFSKPTAITKSCVSKAGFPSLVSDQTKGPFHDRLYYVCISESKQTIVHHSSDAGLTWQGPIVVSNAKKNLVFRRTPSIALNNAGIVGVSWYERVNEGIDNCLQNVYFAASTDGAKSFLPPTRVNSGSRCPDTPRNAQAATRFPAGGDYSGLTATSDGDFRLVWADSRNGTYQLFTTTISVRSALP